MRVRGMLHYRGERGSDGIRLDELFILGEEGLLRLTSLLVDSTWEGMSERGFYPVYERQY